MNYMFFNIEKKKKKIKKYIYLYYYQSQRGLDNVKISFLRFYYLKSRIMGNFNNKWFKIKMQH